MYPSGIRPKSSWFSIVIIVHILGFYAQWPESESLHTAIEQRSSSCEYRCRILQALPRSWTWQAKSHHEGSHVEKSRSLIFSEVGKSSKQQMKQQGAMFHLQIHVDFTACCRGGTFLQLPAAKWGSWKGSSFTMCHAMQNGSSWELPMTFSRSCLPSRLTGVDVTETQTHFIIVSYNMYIQYTYYRTTLVIYFSFYHHIFIIYLNLNLVCIHIIYIFILYYTLITLQCSRSVARWDHPRPSHDLCAPNQLHIWPMHVDVLVARGTPYQSPIDIYLSLQSPRSGQNPNNWTWTSGFWRALEKNDIKSCGMLGVPVRWSVVITWDAFQLLVIYTST